MNEFIEKLIEKIVNTPTECLDTFSVSSVVNGIEYGCASRQNEIIDMINELAEEYNGGWIPCSERLPEEDVEVLVYIKDCEGNYFYDLTYFHIVWQTEIGGMYSSVIAWQPLPEPYNPKGE